MNQFSGLTPASARRSGFTPSWSPSESLFSLTLPVRVKPADRDEFVTLLTVKLAQAQAGDSRSTSPTSALVFEVTDQADPFFLYALRVSEADFHCLKTDQRLLVDYQAFPSMVQKLLGECGHGSAMSATFSIEDCDSATLALVEANQFRELTHFSLRMRRGNDEAVKQYLAGRLGHFRSLSSSLEEKLRACEDELRRTQQSRDSANLQLNVTQQDLELSLRSEQSAHAKELAELKEAHAREIRSIVETSQSKRSSEAQNLREASKAAELRAAAAERQAEDLRSLVVGLESELNSKKRRVQQAETEGASLTKSLEDSRAEVRGLDTLKHQLDKKVGELTVEVNGLRDNLASREKLAGNSAALAEQFQGKIRTLEESLAQAKAQAQSTEASRSESAEALLKAQRAIEAHETAGRAQRAKMKLKVAALHQQESIIQDLEKKLADTARDLQSQKELVDREKENQTRAKSDLDSAQAKLAEAHNLLQSNEQVISYLNKQLTEREVRTFSSTTPNAIAMQLGNKLKTRALATSNLMATPGLPNASVTPKSVPDFPIRSAHPVLDSDFDISREVSRVAPVSFAPKLRNFE